MTIEEVKKMRGGELLAHVRDVLIRRAADIASWEEIEPRPWYANAAKEHDAMMAAAMALEILIAIGKEEIAKGKKPPLLVGKLIEVLRSAHIGEMSKREAA